MAKDSATKNKKTCELFDERMHEWMTKGVLVEDSKGRALDADGEVTDDPTAFCYTRPNTKEMGIIAIWRKTQQGDGEAEAVQADYEDLRSNAKLRIAAGTAD